MPTVNDAAALLLLASNPIRLLIVARLAEGEAGVEELCAAAAGRSTVKIPVLLLQAAGVVEPRAEGRRRFYRLTPDGERLAVVVRAALEMAALATW